MLKKFKLDKQKVEALKEICREENSINIDSEYGGYRFGFLVSKEWRKKNLQFFIKDNIDKYHIESYFKMISQFNTISNDFIEAQKLEPPYKRLLRNSYYRYYINDEVGLVLDDNIDGVIMLNYKRPFGNKCVIGDVFYEFGYDSYDEKFKGVDIEKEYEYLINDTVTKIKQYFITHPFKENLTIESLSSNSPLYWHMGIVEEKKKKSFLDLILSFFRF